MSEHESPAQELARLEIAFEEAGGRGVELAERIDQLRANERLEYIRGELRAERISWGELHELQSLAEHIDPGDVELLEAAGVPEFGPTTECPEKQIAHSFPANKTVVTTLLEMVVDDDTRSDFRWLRLQNGDLMLGVFPRGDGYFEVETEVEFDYKRAERDGNIENIAYDTSDED